MTHSLNSPMLKTLSNRGCTIDLNSIYPTIKIPKNVHIGIKLWGFLDYLKNVYHIDNFRTNN